MNIDAKFWKKVSKIMWEIRETMAGVLKVHDIVLSFENLTIVFITLIKLGSKQQ